MATKQEASDVQDSTQVSAPSGSGNAHFGRSVSVPPKATQASRGPARTAPQTPNSSFQALAPTASAPCSPSHPTLLASKGTSVIGKEQDRDSSDEAGAAKDKPGSAKDKGDNNKLTKNSKDNQAKSNRQWRRRSLVEKFHDSRKRTLKTKLFRSGGGTDGGDQGLRDSSKRDAEARQEISSPLQVVGQGGRRSPRAAECKQLWKLTWTYGDAAYEHDAHLLVDLIIAGRLDFNNPACQLALRQCTSIQLCYLLPHITSLFHQLPFWIQGQSEELRSTLQERIWVDVYLRQAIQCLKDSALLATAGAQPQWLSRLDTSHSANLSNEFTLLGGNAVVGRGFTHHFSQAPQVLHPFLLGMVLVAMRVEHVLPTNAKPLLVSVRCVPLTVRSGVGVPQHIFEGNDDNITLDCGEHALAPAALPSAVANLQISTSSASVSSAVQCAFSSSSSISSNPSLSSVPPSTSCTPSPSTTAESSSSTSTSPTRSQSAASVPSSVSSSASSLASPPPRHQHFTQGWNDREVEGNGSEALTRGFAALTRLAPPHGTCACDCEGSVHKKETNNENNNTNTDTHNLQNKIDNNVNQTNNNNKNQPNNKSNNNKRFDNKDNDDDENKNHSDSNNNNAAKPTIAGHTDSDNTKTVHRSKDDQGSSSTDQSELITCLCHCHNKHHSLSRTSQSSLPPNAHGNEQNADDDDTGVESDSSMSDRHNLLARMRRRKEVLQKRREQTEEGKKRIGESGVETGSDESEDEEEEDREYMATVRTTMSGGQMIVKNGDDLRMDQACLQVFSLLTRLWQQERLELSGLPVVALQYGVCALSRSCGVIQFIPDCVPLKKLGREVPVIATERGLTRLITTAAGAFVAGFVLGVADRHDDNILVCKNDASLFHIDFGHILGVEPTIDTAAFAITKDLQRAMGDRWSTFVDLCVKAFVVLRKHERVITGFTVGLLGPFKSAPAVAEFIRRKLKMDVDLGTACIRLRKQVIEAPKQLKTKFKNAVHAVAQKLQNDSRDSTPKHLPT